MWVFISTAVGLVVGSFLNVFTLRIAADEPFVRGRSRCPHCRTELAARDLIPVLSYLLLNGRCRYCHASLSLQYPLVEAATAGAFALVALKYAAEGWLGVEAIYLVRDLVVVAGLIALFVFDFRWMIVPDIVSLPLTAWAALMSWWLGVPLALVFLGVTVGAGFFAALYVFSRGRWIGSGDIRLGALMGAATGWPGVVAGLYLTYFMGGLVALGLLLGGRRRVGEAIPLGTFITLATFLVLLFPERAAIFSHWLTGGYGW